MPANVETLLQAREELFRLFIEQVVDYAMFLLDADGRVASWNIGAERIKGYAGNEILGRHFSAFYPEKDIRAGKCEYELEEATKNGRFEDEGWRIRKDGSQFWANVIITPVRDALGSLVGFAKVTRDLTERVAAEEAKRNVAVLERMQTLGALAQAISGALTTDDVSNVIVERVMQAVHADTCTLYTLDPRTHDLVLAIERGVSRELVEGLRIIRADSPVCRSMVLGEYLWVENEEQYRARYPDLASLLAKGPRARAFWSAPLVAEGRSIGLLGMGFYTERAFSPEEREFVRTVASHCAEAMLRAQRLESEKHARQVADEANRAKDEFLAVVSHELRTPLNAILGWAKIMNAPHFDEARRASAIDTIERNAVVMAQLIEDLLDMSRIISGKMRLEVQRVDLALVIESAIDSIRPAADAKGVSVVSSLERVTSGFTGDPTRLQQVVWNLLSNAVKFTPRGGRVVIELLARDSSIEIGVTDTGQGIASAFVPHVFDPFRQEDASFTRARGGLGLGLAITRQLVELHGGTITAASAGEGQGATFTVSLPTTSEVRSSGARPRAATPVAASGALENLDVLVVDDEEDARELVKAVLEQCGCKVRTASSVDAALASIETRVPHLIVSDVGMPERDGYDLIRHLRAQTPECGANVPAIALTAYARAEDRRRLLEAGYSTHVAKPVEPAELVAVVTSVVRAHAAGSAALSGS